MPTVHVGEPDKSINNYQTLEVSGIKIYLAPSLADAGDKLRIEMTGFWLFRDLEIVGLKCP